MTLYCDFAQQRPRISAGGPVASLKGILTGPLPKYRRRMAIAAVVLLIATLVIFAYKSLRQSPAKGAAQAKPIAASEVKAKDQFDDGASTRSAGLAPRAASGLEAPSIVLSDAPATIPENATAGMNKSMNKSDEPASTVRQPASMLMPPPSRPTAIAQRRPVSAVANMALRVPTTGPLPKRLPPATSSLARPSPVTGGAIEASTSTLAPAARPRRKVILDPGHSPLDWAHLTKTDKTLPGVPLPQRVTASQLAAANGRKGAPAWSSYHGRVYNIGPYLPFHPGGRGELMRAAGRDGAPLFQETHPWVNWEAMLGACLVGWLVSEGEGEGQDTGLDSLD